MSVAPLTWSAGFADRSAIIVDSETADTALLCAVEIPGEGGKTYAEQIREISRADAE